MRQPGKDKILLLINCLQGGGAERSVLTLGQGFYELDYEVHIIRFKSTVEYELTSDLIYHQVNFKPFKLVPHAKLRHQLFAHKVDSYVRQNIGIPLLTIANLDRADRVLAFSKLPNVIHIIRNTISKEIDQKDPKGTKTLLLQLQSVYDHQPCIGISQGVTEDFKKTLNLKNIKTIYNPIDKLAIQSLASESISITEPYIIHVGSFKFQKAHDILIRAYANTSKKFRLLLLGQGTLLVDMKNLVKQLNIESNVVFLGFKSNPYPYIKNAKFMVLSSRFEGFGRVIAEALALQTPVISTDCPSGPSEMLPQHNLTPVNKIDALSEKIEEAMRDANTFKVEFNEQLLPKNIASQYIELIKR